MKPRAVCHLSVWKPNIQEAEELRVSPVGRPRKMVMQRPGLGWEEGRRWPN